MKLIFILLVAYLGYFVLKSIAMKNRVGRPRSGHNRTTGPQGYTVPRKEWPGRATGADARPEPQSDPGEEMVLDPVCSSYVPLSAAVKKGVGKGVVYFCSVECREKYKG